MPEKRCRLLIVGCAIIAIILATIVMQDSPAGNEKEVDVEDIYATLIPEPPRQLTGTYCDQLRQYVPQDEAEAMKWAEALIRGNAKGRILIMRFICGKDDKAIYGFAIHPGDEIVTLIPARGEVMGATVEMTLLDGYVISGTTTRRSKPGQKPVPEIILVAGGPGKVIGTSYVVSFLSDDKYR